jgi:predicted acyl esterase
LAGVRILGARERIAGRLGIEGGEMVQEVERARPLPGLPEVTVQRNVACRMRDGVTLYADVYRPAGQGPFPVILMRLPYDKTQAENISYSHPSWYAQRG